MSLVHVSVLGNVDRRSPSIAVHRRSGLRREEITSRHGIPVTKPTRTLIDLAACCGRTEGPFGCVTERRVEGAIIEADQLDLLTPGRLRAALDDHGGERGVRVLRRLLRPAGFRLTDSELERRFLRLVRNAGLPVPLTAVRLNGFKVDFFWSDLGLVIETDGLTYHRTPEQQLRDRRRDQMHTAAGLTCLRFTHYEVRYEPEHVISVLAEVIARLSREPRRAS
jgi:very-short-patch-repair endonuclease